MKPRVESGKSLGYFLRIAVFILYVYLYFLSYGFSFFVNIFNNSCRSPEAIYSDQDRKKNRKIINYKWIIVDNYLVITAHDS